jgi:hypothetical protein
MATEKVHRVLDSKGGIADETHQIEAVLTIDEADELEGDVVVMDTPYDWRPVAASHSGSACKIQLTDIRPEGFGFKTYQSVVDGYDEEVPLNGEVVDIATPTAGWSPL